MLFPGRISSKIISDSGFVLITSLASLRLEIKISISSLLLKKFGFILGRSNGLEEFNVTSPRDFGFIIHGVSVTP